MDTLKGKNALVTGGASGIGAATARLLAAAGAHVTVVDLPRAAAAGHPLADDIGGTFVGADVGDLDDWARIRCCRPRRRLHLNAGVVAGTDIFASASTTTAVCSASTSTAWCSECARSCEDVRWSRRTASGQDRPFADDPV